MTISLKPETSATLNEGMQAVGAAIELPFPAPVFYVVNGDPRLKSAGGAQYYGGWATDADKLIEASVVWTENGTVPDGLERTEMMSAGNKTLDVFTARSIVVAPIDMRKSWFTQDQNGSIQRSPDYFQGARQHIQALCMLAEKHEDGTFLAWGPCVLSAKGMQAKRLHYSFTDWSRKIASTRKKIAPDVPDFCFYLAIGTFGKERKSEMVGQQGAQSAITPIGAYLPETISEQLLESLFVGQDVADQMALIRNDAAEWLTAWGTPTQKNGGQKHGGGHMAGPAYPEDEIPF